MINEKKKNLGESIQQRLKNLSGKQNRSFDDILRYYAMERFLYRLSISAYTGKFFLKGALMLKILPSVDHRATMDIDLLGKTSNQTENLQHIIRHICSMQCEEDAMHFDAQGLILKQMQTGGDYHGIRCSFIAKLYKTRMPILIDIGFNDVVIPGPTRIQFPTLLDMPKPILMGYTFETVIAEKLETIVKKGIVNTRLKDFYDIWTILKNYAIEERDLREAINRVFAHRQTPLRYPLAFTEAFYNEIHIQQKWKNFLILIKTDRVDLKEVIIEISNKLKNIFQ